MKTSTYLLLALLLVLGVIVLFLMPSTEERESSDTSPGLTVAIDSASVAKIEIHRAGRSLTLENVGGRWMLTAGGSYRADPAAVQQLLSELRKLRIGSHISSNPERQHIFQVDSSGTTLVVTERSGKSTSLIVGKMGPSFSEIYVRQPAAKEVFLAEGLETWTINKEAKEWRDRTVLALPAEAVNGLTYTVGGKEYAFRRDSTTWTSGSSTVETSVMNPPLAALANLRADSFIDTALRVETNPLSVSVQGAQNVALNFFPTLPDSAVYYVQASNSSQWFVVNKAAVRQIFTPVEHPAASAAPVTAAEHAAAAPPVTVPKTTHAPPKKVTTERAGTESKTPAARNPLTRSTQTPPASTRDALRSMPLGTRAPGAPKPGGTGATAPTQTKPAPSTGAAGAAEDEGELSVHTVAKGETMQSIALKYNVTVEQMMKWNLLKTIVVKPGQELYIFQKKK